MALTCISSTSPGNCGHRVLVFEDGKSTYTLTVHESDMVGLSPVEQKALDQEKPDADTLDVAKWLPFLVREECAKGVGLAEFSGVELIKVVK